MLARSTAVQRVLRIMEIVDPFLCRHSIQVCQVVSALLENFPLSEGERA